MYGEQTLQMKPNVVFVLVDDMGYGDMGVFNGGITSTRHVDSLVEDGVLFTDCYSSSPVCAPARASILTGKYPQRTGVIDTLESRGHDRLKLSETTLADLFQRNGYKTGLIGKWHLGSIGDEYHPSNRGFDYFFGFRGGWTDYYDYQNLQRNGVSVPSDGSYLTERLSDDAVRFVRENKDQPFFLHLTYNAPHFPFQAPDSAIEKYREQGSFTEATSCIYAMIEEMDNGLGKILSELRKLDIERNTIVVFTSDNGPDFGGEGDQSAKRFNCDLKGSKMRVYEGGIKVPAVVRWTGNLSPSRCNHVISHLDWFPTLVEICELESEEDDDVDGVSLAGALYGDTLPDRKLFWQWNRHIPKLEGNAAVRDGNMKLLHAPIEAHLALPRWEIAIDEDIKKHPDLYPEVLKIEEQTPVEPVEPVVELYDLHEDPTESNDLVQCYPDRVQELEEYLRGWFTKVEHDRLSPDCAAN